MDTREAFNNLNPIALFAGCILPIIATPIGIGVAFVVRRIIPMANILTATLLAGYIVTVVILFAALRRLLPDTVLNIYAAATVSVVAATGFVFFVTFFVYRKLYIRETELKAAFKEQHTFAVYGQDLRGKSSHSRRSKK